MGRKISQEALRKHKEESLKTLETYIDSLINDENPKIQSKADKLSFWLEHWTTFLSFESKFRSTSLRRYKRGEIIKVHLGYNIGSEEGGLHYCVVVEKNNSKLATTSSTGGLLLALQRAIVTARPKGRYRKHFC